MIYVIDRDFVFQRSFRFDIIILAPYFLALPPIEFSQWSTSCNEPTRKSQGHNLVNVCYAGESARTGIRLLSVLRILRVSISSQLLVVPGVSPKIEKADFEQTPRL
jgi:hypothetical protein